MARAKQLRWAVLLSALAATVAAILMPEEEATTSSPLPTVAKPISAAPGASLSAVPPSEPPREWLGTDENPFAPRGWTASPPPPPPNELRTVIPVALTEAPPAPLPTLPFRFLGQMTDGDDRVIYLGQGEQLLAARAGDVLDGRYKVLSIAVTQMEFEDTSSGLRQTLSLPAQDK